jgi:hypothetical protein
MTTEQAVERLGSSPLTTGSKSTKFTPERLQQIKNLVERGKSRDEIADILDVTVGSLQVTCSRLGISLKRPKIDNGVWLRKRTPLLVETSYHSSDQNGRASEPGKPASIAQPEQQRATIPGACAARFAISIQYRGMKRTHELPLTTHTIGLLALEATLREVSIGELIAEILKRAMADKNLFQRVLGDINPGT